jgi:hypothetical protein
MKGHTGAILSLGEGPIRVRSSKQKLVTKSSTESELVAVSDELTHVIWVRNMLLDSGYSIGPAKIMQDNQSTIIIANRGRSTSNRTRHISIRHFFVKDRVDTNEVSLEYLSTNEMLADMLTKPLQGERFRIMRKDLMNLDD